MQIYKRQILSKIPIQTNQDINNKVLKVINKVVYSGKKWV